MQRPTHRDRETQRQRSRRSGARWGRGGASRERLRETSSEVPGDRGGRGWIPSQGDSPTPTPPRVPPAEVRLLHTGLGLRSDHVLTLPSTTGVLLSPKVTFLTENSFLPIARVACFVERQELPFSIITKEDLIRTKHSHRRLSSLPAWVHGPGGRLPPAVCAC